MVGSSCQVPEDLVAVGETASVSGRETLSKSAFVSSLYRPMNTNETLLLYGRVVGSMTLNPREGASQPAKELSKGFSGILLYCEITILRITWHPKYIIAMSVTTRVHFNDARNSYRTL